MLCRFFLKTRERVHSLKVKILLARWSSIISNVDVIALASKYIMGLQ